MYIILVNSTPKNSFIVQTEKFRLILPLWQSVIVSKRPTSSIGTWQQNKESANGNRAK